MKEAHTQERGPERREGVGGRLIISSCLKIRQNEIIDAQPPRPPAPPPPQNKRGGEEKNWHIENKKPHPSINTAKLD